MPYLKSFFVFFCLILTMTFASAEIYYWTDKNGIKHFADNADNNDKEAIILKIEEAKHHKQARHSSKIIRAENGYEPKNLNVSKSNTALSQGTSYKEQVYLEKEKVETSKEDQNKSSKSDLPHTEVTKIEPQTPWFVDGGYLKENKYYGFQIKFPHKPQDRKLKVDKYIIQTHTCEENISFSDANSSDKELLFRHKFLWDLPEYRERFGDKQDLVDPYKSIVRYRLYHTAKAKKYSKLRYRKKDINSAIKNYVIGSLLHHRLNKEDIEFYNFSDEESIYPTFNYFAPIDNEGWVTEGMSCLAYGRLFLVGTTYNLTYQNRVRDRISAFFKSFRLFEPIRAKATNGVLSSISTSSSSLPKQLPAYEKGQLVGSLAFGAMTLDAFYEICYANGNRTDNNLHGIKKLVKEKWGIDYAAVQMEQEKRIGRNYKKEAHKLIEVMIQKYGGCNTHGMDEWVRNTQAIHEKNLNKFHAVQ